MSTNAAEIDNATFASLMGGDWRRTYASSRASGQRMFVFQNSDDPRDIRVLRSDDKCPGASELQVPGHGEMYCHSFSNDPALPAIPDILDRYLSCRVLRYRPGKRITLAATDRMHGPVIIKCVAAGATQIYSRLCAVWAARSDLAFDVSRPIDCFPDANTFIQASVPGKPIGLSSDEFTGGLVRKMAEAINSLHYSDAIFLQDFDTFTQQQRSARYLRAIQYRVPSLADIVDAIAVKLENLRQRIDYQPGKLVAIHGSLHSHQWLYDGDRLVLVDFDRAANGHRELDIATFLAEFDYETPSLGVPVNRAFLAGFGNYDLRLLTYYRAHKHVAKAFKASKSARESTANTKARRNLNRALSIVDGNWSDLS